MEINNNTQTTNSTNNKNNSTSDENSTSSFNDLLNQKSKIEDMVADLLSLINTGLTVSELERLEELLAKVNDKLVQLATYDLMIYKPYKMIDEINSFMNLEDGDIIMSGTPKGVNNYNIGDVFKGQIYCKDKLLVESVFVV
ncbi:MAG: fumarylacetoacetate hydrolase family protein [Campylobacterota bacterium]|nr:fumarylacetoacetate hydrolase family protein [Campylobacterota bacterium]